MRLRAPFGGPDVENEFTPFFSRIVDIITVALEIAISYYVRLSCSDLWSSTELEIHQQEVTMQSGGTTMRLQARRMFLYLSQSLFFLFSLLRNARAFGQASGDLPNIV